MEEEFSEDIDDLKTGNDTVYFKPVREAGGHYLYLDQKPSRHPNFGQTTDAIQRAFTYNMEGVDYRQNNGVAYVTMDGRIKLFSFFFKPFLTFREVSSGNTNFTFQKGYGKFGSKVQIQFGQDSKWWGQGRHGSLLLSNNAEPLLAVEVKNGRPILIPLFGLLKFNVFFGWLEKDRDFERPYISGMRLTFKPRPWMEFGFYRTAIFGGSGRPSLDFGDALEIIFIGRSDSEKFEDNTSNQIAGLDIRINLKKLKTDLYFEWAGEDVHSDIPYPYKRAHIIGVYMADVLGFSVRSEFFESKRPGVWYRHGVYTSGYTFKERVLGHHAGGDAEDLFIELHREFSDNIGVTGSFDIEKRGFNLPVLETHYQYQGKIRLRFYPYLAELTGGWEQVKNPGFAPGKREDNYVGIISVKRFF